MNNSQKKFLMLILLVVGCFVTSLLTNLSDEAKEDKPAHSLLGEEAAASSKKTKIRIYVSGAVVKPGLYDVPVDSRADEAIKVAGGCTELADLDRVNLARKLKDGAQVNVPTRKLGKNNKTSGENKKSSAIYERENVKSKTKQDAKLKDKNSAGLSININTASAAELEQLPGIGPAMAQKIIQQRELSRFTSAEDLLKVKGIGKAKLNRIREYVRTE